MDALMHTEFLVHHCFLAKTVADRVSWCVLFSHAYAEHFRAAQRLSCSLQPSALQLAECPHTWCNGLLTAPKASKAGCLSHAEQA